MDLDRDVGPYLDLLPPAPVSHLPAFMDASAAGMFRARAHSSAMPCSAAATVLAVGALTTRQPHCRGIGAASELGPCSVRNGIHHQAPPHDGQ